MIFEVENDNPIMIVYKKSVIKEMDENLLGQIEDKFHNNRKKDFYVVIVPLVTKILNHPVYVLEVDNSITKGGSDIEFQNKFNKKAANKFRIEHYYTNNFGIKIISSMFGQVKNEIYKNVGEENKGFIDYIIIFKKVGSEDELYNYLLGEVADGDSEIEEEPEESEDPIYDTTDPFAEKYNNKKGDYYADSGFNVGVHAFNFENLSTKVSSGGVCAGFSFVTTNIFNNGTKVKRELPSKYNMNSSDYDVIWNGNLYNYQPSSPGLKTYADLEENRELLNSSIMSKPDSEVVKLLEHYFIEYNDKVRMTKLEWALNKSKKKTYISEKTIKNLVEEFKSGKIVSVNLLSDDGQHAVNAYRIVEDENNPDILYLKVYDNNFPYDMYWHPNKKGKVKYDVTIVLKRIYENTAFGEKIKYSYAYNPINSSNYVYGTDRYCFDGIVFIDENYNTI